MRANKENRLPREIWVAAISLKGLWPEKTIEKRIKDMLERMESVYPLEPDIICLPETFQISWVDEIKTLEEIAEEEDVPGPVTARIAEMAKKHNCYIVCPVITKKDGHFYNSSILLNRRGEIDGIYHKIHPTDTETLPDVYYKGGGQHREHWSLLFSKQISELLECRSVWMHRGLRTGDCLRKPELKWYSFHHRVLSEIPLPIMPG